MVLTLCYPSGNIVLEREVVKMYVIKCIKNKQEFYLKRTGFKDEFTSNKDNAKTYKKEISASVDVRLVNENDKNISCEIINVNPKYVRVFV
jgi:hypothetical protein